jgi:hypothetical protein
MAILPAAMPSLCRNLAVLLKTSTRFGTLAETAPQKRNNNMARHISRLASKRCFMLIELLVSFINYLD